MRVDLKTYGLAPPEEKKTERPGAPAAEKHSSESTAADRARFSFDQARVRGLEAQVLAQPEVREQKVELLRQALGKGEYASARARLPMPSLPISPPGARNSERGRLWSPSLPTGSILPCCA